MSEPNSKIGTTQRNGKATATLATSVYDRLRDDVLAGRLKPGEKLRTDLLRTRYRIGNSPIREALNRLSADGLVERLDQRGFRVSSVSKNDLLELTKTRCLLEEVAVRESIAVGGIEWEEGLVLAFHRLSRFDRPGSDRSKAVDPQWQRLHRAFHIALLSGCGSSRLIGYCEELFDKFERYRRLAASDFCERDDLDEHRGLMDAAIDGDMTLFVRLLKDHHGRTADAVLSSGTEYLSRENDVTGGN